MWQRSIAQQTKAGHRGCTISRPWQTNTDKWHVWRHSCLSSESGSPRPLPNGLPSVFKTCASFASVCSSSTLPVGGTIYQVCDVTADSRLTPLDVSARARLIYFHLAPSTFHPCVPPASFRIFFTCCYIIRFQCVQLAGQGLAWWQDGFSDVCSVSLRMYWSSSLLFVTKSRGKVNQLGRINSFVVVTLHKHCAHWRNKSLRTLH